MDAVGVALRSDRLHAVDVLETQILSDQFALPGRIHYT